MERVWAHGNDDLFGHLQVEELDGPPSIGRPPRTHKSTFWIGICSQSRSRRERLSGYRRCWSRARISEPARADGRAICAASVRHRGRGAPVPDRGPGALSRRWTAAVPRTHRSAAQGARSPDRTREIEATLREQPGVQMRPLSCPTAARAYSGWWRIVAGEGGAPSAGELRALLRTTLPDYMVPSILVALGDELPLTPNGKVDYPPAALDMRRPELERPFVAPRTDTETRLADTWAQVLKLERMGVHDNFFELGGHCYLGDAGHDSCA